jgi:hypothetical protein
MKNKKGKLRIKNEKKKLTGRKELKIGPEWSLTNS